MARIDVFNGDADGICALVQLRNDLPVESRLVTGVKRDIALLAKAGIGPGDQVTVLDVSLDKNRGALREALEQGARVFYADHHFAGEIPVHENLHALIDPAPGVCTSILVSRHLEGRYLEWAVTGAFGDNLRASARALALPLGLPSVKLELLERLGIYVNYNSYGASLEDLHFPPAELFRLLQPFASPFELVRGSPEIFERLEAGYRQDMARAKALGPERESEGAAVFILPDRAWARRVSGVFSNDLANAAPRRAHAVLTERPDGTYLVSVRAPVRNPAGADGLCRRFPTGGGRKAAAGINHLPADRLEDFITQFTGLYRA